MGLCTDVQEKELNRVNNKECIWKRAHIAKHDMPQAVNGHGLTYSENNEIGFVETSYRFSLSMFLKTMCVNLIVIMMMTLKV